MPSRKYKSASPKSSLVICKCKSRCTTFNPSSRSYEGSGKPVSRSIRNRHARDDRILAARERVPQHTESSRRQGLQTTTTQNDLVHEVVDAWAHHVNLLEREVEWYCQLPFTTPTAPLSFVNNPALFGEYVLPAVSELVRANHGLYALRSGIRANATFLVAEHRFCEIISLLISKESSTGDPLRERLYHELTRMSLEKGISWAQQRSHLEPGRILVNTGRLDLSSTAFSI
jgi:hypothetical protein